MPSARSPTRRRSAGFAAVPELPEVEVVRRGVRPYVEGRVVLGCEIFHPRAVRHHPAGGSELVAACVGRRIRAARRRGKFLWFELSDGGALMVHLGMSGQLRVDDDDRPHRHLRARFLLDDGRRVSFLDQRTFGYLRAARVVAGVPEPIAHIAPDLLEIEPARLAPALRRGDTELKRVLLNQEILSGVGNIYADEMLWVERLHARQRSGRVSVARLARLLRSGREIMRRAIERGGTSFDALYVNVNGRSGYFGQDLNAYGRQGQPCPRCGAPIVREAFMNRSSHFCPHCQRRY